MKKKRKDHILQLIVSFSLTLFVNLLSCGNSAADVPQFDSQAAFAYLEKQCAFGPRVPGSPEHAACRDFLVQELTSCGARVNSQAFMQKMPGTAKVVTLTNIIASFAPEKTDRILLCAHWDTRPRADEDPYPINRDKPVPGANDGASGVAVLLEVAKALHSQPPPVGVDIIFFDGEDSGTSGFPDTYALGAQYFAKNKDPRYVPRFGILLDMVGDADLQIYQEGNSVDYALDIVDKVWERAIQLDLMAFIPSVGYTVTDDHMPLLNAGIRCIDIIDFDYDYWHTVDDTPDKCSKESLGEVGELILSIVYNGL
jgi:hypothetical protein